MESGLVRFDTGDGDGIVVEIAENDAGFLRAASADGSVARAAATFDGALRDVARAADSALRTFRDGPLKPDAVELEFGIKLNAEVGAVIAKSALEGHLAVKLSWSSTPQDANGATSEGA